MARLLACVLQVQFKQNNYSTQKNLLFILDYPSRRLLVIDAIQDMEYRSKKSGGVFIIVVKFWITSLQAVTTETKRARQMKNKHTEITETIADNVSTLDEVSKRLKTSVKSLRRAIARGELGCVRIGNSIRILDRHVYEFLHRNEVPAGRSRGLAKKILDKSA